jgi:hypothetical protein
MNGITVYYKKKEWTQWVSWPCQTETEAEKVRQALLEQGYELRK